jgi:hypothetical protein
MKVKHILIGVGIVLFVIIIYFIFFNNNQVKNSNYDCNFVWPQEIINKETRSVLWICPLPRGYCKQGTTKCCEWTELRGHYNCVNMINIGGQKNEKEETSTTIPIDSPLEIETTKIQEDFVFDSTDPLMIKCKADLDVCAVDAMSSSSLTIKIVTSSLP